MIDKLARLLATENIVVEHRNAPTASFDTKNRILTLPTWKDVGPSLETLLVGHEVGHALYTPDSGWRSLNAQERTICNVVEDARIERKMKIKYPGLRRDFYEGYKDLFEKDFFKIKDKKIEKMNFLDRLNLHFKIGSFTSVPFQDDEKCFVDSVENAKTWDEIVGITHEIFDFLSKKEDAQDPMNLNLNDDEDKNDLEPSELENFEEEKEEEADGDDDLKEEELDHYSCNTQMNMDDSIAENLIDDKSKPIFYVNFQDVEYKERTVSYTKMIQMFTDEKNEFISSEIKFGYRDSSDNGSSTREVLNAKIAKQNKILWNKFLGVNSKVVSYLVKEFEMKKAADHYVRQRESKTGVINSNKLHAYKIIDDIFRKTTILPESKNHGLVLFVDFSGSMSDNIHGTIEQLLCLTLFCRRVNIPHRVYAFTDQLISQEYLPNMIESSYPIGDIVVKQQDKLLELFTEKMRNSQFSEMGQWLLNFAQGVKERSLRYRSTDTEFKWYSHSVHLNSTPLNSALIYARKIITEFKKQTNAQIVNCVVLTDGESNMNTYMTPNGLQNFGFSGRCKMIARDVQTKEEIVLKKSVPNGRFDGPSTEVFVQFLRNRCDVSVICYRIENSNSSIKKTINAAYPENIEIAQINYRKMRKQKYFHMKGHMKFDDYFLICGGENINTEDSLLGDEVYDNKNSLAKAFMKANVRRGISRVLLSKFIEKIAA